MPDINDAAERVKMTEAAKRLIAQEYDINGEFLIGPNGEKYSRTTDGHFVARAFLSQLAERDETPIDEAWLRSIGFKHRGPYKTLGLQVDKQNGGTWSLEVADYENLPDTPWELWSEADLQDGMQTVREGVMLPCEPKTRDDVWRLLSALNIPTGEAK